MLLSMRDGVKNSKWLKYVIIGVISVPFVLFGVGSYLGGGGDTYAAKVNGSEISLRTYEQLYGQQRNRLRQAFGGKIPEGLGGDFIRKQALDAAITQEVLLQESANNGYAVSDAQLADEIANIAAFNTDTGFDKDRYQRQLQSMGMTATQFEMQLRRDVTVDQLRRGIGQTAFLLPGERSRLDNLRAQERQVATLTFVLEPLMASIELTDEELRSYFETNQARYQHPEKLRVDYLELSVSDLIADISVIEDDLQALYEETRSSYAVPEERSASHILLSLASDANESDVAEKQAAAEALRARIEAGESFADLAKDNSDDPGSAAQGGSLGSFPRGAMVPEFENAAFAMAAGDISQPVRSDFGFHIIRLDEITAERGKAFDEVRAQLETEFRKREAESLYFERVDQLSNAAYENSGSLDPAAESTGLTVQASSWIDVNSNEGIGRFETVRRAAFSADVRNESLNSDVLEVGENHVVVLRLKEQQAAKPKTFDEVRDQVDSALRRQKAEELLEEKVKLANAALQGGENAQSVAEREGAVWAEPVWVARRGAADTAPAVVQQLFRLSQPAEGQAEFGEASLPAGDRAVLVFDAVRSGEAAEVSAERVDQDAQRRGNIEYGALVETLRNQAEVERNLSLLEQLDNR